MKTLEQACEIQGITKTEGGLNLHFSPIPNWYHCFTGFDCPICDNPIDWDWHFAQQLSSTQQIPPPTVTGAKYITHGHRWIKIEGDKCHTHLTAENFD